MSAGLPVLPPDPEPLLSEPEPLPVPPLKNMVAGVEMALLTIGGAALAAFLDGAQTMLSSGAPIDWQRLKSVAIAAGLVSALAVLKKSPFRQARLGLLLLLCCSTPAFAETPGFSIEGWMGVQGAIPSNADTQMMVEPYVEIMADAPLADAEKAPRLLVDGAFEGLPGEAISLTDITSFNAITLDVKLVQPLSDSLYFKPYLEGGLATRLRGSHEPSDTLCWHFGGGVRLAASRNRGWLELGFGADQRLTGLYQPAVTIGTGFKVWSQKTTDKLHGVKMVLRVSVIAGLQQTSSPNRHIVMAALAGGF